MLKYADDGSLYEDGQPNFNWVDQNKEPLKITVNPSKPEWVDSIPAPLQNPDASPAEIAAFRTARSVKGNALPVADDRYSWLGPKDPVRPSYIMEPDLMEAQGGMHLPEGLMQNDNGGFYYQDDPNKTIPLVRRPGLLPIANTPEGYKFAVPKLVDIVGNVMGNVGGPLKVATKGNEMVLGAGMVRTANEAAKEVGPFYSSLERAVEGSKINLATPEQWLGYLKNQPGVKAEELGIVLKELSEKKIDYAQFKQDYKEKMGVDISGYDKQKLDRLIKGIGDTVLVKYMKEGMLSKQQLEEFVKANKVELKEKVLSDIPAKYDTKTGQPDRTYPEGTPFEPTKYHQYQLPGGENYKETLLSLPHKNGDIEAKLLANSNRIEELRAKMRGTSGTDEIRKEIRQIQNENDMLSRERVSLYKAPHFDEHGTNLVAHVRHNDRYMVDENKLKELNDKIKSFGITSSEQYATMNKKDYNELQKLLKEKDEYKGSKSLHLEEVQSDWHQQGRKHGYKGEKEKLEPEFNKIDEKIIGSNDETIMGQPKVEDALKLAVEKKIITKNEADVYKRYTDIENGKPVPDAPFKKSWDELALKRMLHKAANEGYDALSWTPGEAQAARYDLSKQINRIKIDTTPADQSHRIVRLEQINDNKINIQIDKDGKVVSSHPANANQFEGKSLEDVVGKEIAEKIVDKIKNEKPYKPITELPDEFTLIHDANGKKNGQEWGILPKGQSHAGSATGRYHKTQKEAVDEMLMQINHNEKIRHEDIQRTLENVDLKIGGEGMKTFYDKMLVDKANNLAKKYGGKVESRDISVGPQYKSLAHFMDWAEAAYPNKYSRNQLGDFWKHGEQIPIVKEFVNSSKKQPIHYLPITDALRAKAKEGFSLFSTTPILNPVDYVPQFEDKKKVKLVPVSEPPEF